MYYLSHSKSKDPIPDNLLKGSFDLKDGRFVSFCDRFKYLRTYITPNLRDNFDIEARIMAAKANFYAYKESLYCNFEIDIKIRKEMYMAMTLNILLWGIYSWALSEIHLKKLSSFHNRCTRAICRCPMDLVQERHIKMAKLHGQLNMPDMEALVTIRQLRFLIRVAKMDESRLTRQVMSSQGARTKDTNVRGSKLTSRSVYRNALIRGGIISEEEKKSCILTDTWTR